MTYRGTVKDGVVVLPPEAGLPDGTTVEVQPVSPDGSGPDPLDELLHVAGRIEGLPRDLAAQHDHYLHGTPKR